MGSFINANKIIIDFLHINCWINLKSKSCHKHSQSHARRQAKPKFQPAVLAGPRPNGIREIGKIIFLMKNR